MPGDVSACRRSRSALPLLVSWLRLPSTQTSPVRPLDKGVRGGLCQGPDSSADVPVKGSLVSGGELRPEEPDES